VPLHDARPAEDHEPAGGLVRDRNREHCAGMPEVTQGRGRFCRLQRCPPYDHQTWRASRDLEGIKQKTITGGEILNVSHRQSD
jgi:hypothetical protein